MLTLIGNILGLVRSVIPTLGQEAIVRVIAGYGICQGYAITCGWSLDVCVGLSGLGTIRAPIVINVVVIIRPFSIVVVVSVWVAVRFTSVHYISWARLVLLRSLAGVTQWISQGHTIVSGWWAGSSILSLGYRAAWWLARKDRDSVECKGLFDLFRGKAATARRRRRGWRNWSGGP